MLRLVILGTLFAICSARPGLVGHGISAIAAPAIAVAPAVSVNSGVSTQSRVDYRTPVVASVAVPAVATSVALPAVAPAAYGIGYGSALSGGYGGYGSYSNGHGY
ncbi:cuticle protein 64-like [Diabrotica virgifera virgifera]|uniref:Cuticle protein 64-like n=1 Tax=Diabrotica virgifera virgifera TaxID=50390 RepID=A0A6P7GVW1_DIAVI|nr:cuticle protein 64-like [Diabrotica virgifera virgifera]